MAEDIAEPTFTSDAAAIAHYRQLCASLQSQLAAAEQDILEFTESSKDLQAELESELERMDKAEKGMRKELDDTKNEKDEWKGKYTTALRDHTSTITHMQRELETLRATEKQLRTRLRDMELDNDDLEKSEREKDSSLQDLETRYNKSLERIALLEEELVAKAQLEEEVQRLKDDLRDVNEELVVTRSQAQAVSEALAARKTATVVQPAPPSPPRSEPPETEQTVSTPRRAPSPASSPPPSIELVKPTPATKARPRPTSMIASPPTSISPSKIARPPSSALPFPSPSPTGQTPFRAPLGRSTRTAHLQSYGLPASPSSPALASPSRSRVPSRTGSGLGASTSSASATSGIPRTDTATMIRDMQQMTSRVRQLTQRLDHRRSSVMRGSAIPRIGSPSTANIAGLARGDGADSPTAMASSTMGRSRSGLSSVGGTSTRPASSVGAPRPPSRLGERDSTRPPSRSAALRASIASSMAASAAARNAAAVGAADSTRPSRPSSRMSTASGTSVASYGASNGRPMTPGAGPARSVTPSAGRHHYDGSRPASSLSSSSAAAGGSSYPARPGSSLGRSTLSRSVAGTANGHGRTGSASLVGGAVSRSGRATPSSYGGEQEDDDLRATVRRAPAAAVGTPSVAGNRRASGIGLPGQSALGRGVGLGRRASLAGTRAVSGRYEHGGAGVGERDEVPPVPPLPLQSRTGVAR
ncbi:hypothetical protein BMF94_3361 [Rhodotorula taiwanensis]|uniref:NUDE domain-containing protein n=1 Tax=Rhodotorula taiwanensis TaxID=741276 RepID=A0A2S5BAL6_9BASI|nr:hypothetical protein BMF94_3361 [Rhodotorula taiwanensis]